MRTVSETNHYIAKALQTIKYVDAAMDIGTSNKFFPNFRGLPARLACVSAETDSIRKELQQQLPHLRSEPDRTKRRVAIAKAEVESAASWGKLWGCGNCGVQSARAFVRLRDFWKIFPLEWMQLKHGDHGFVIIGRETATNPANPRTWNDDAILCDPWHGFSGRMSAQPDLSSREIEVIYRQDAA